ncbi:MAG: hypothetical protein VKK94_06705 [Cyanobacteriota bacterium]|jgi:hypothetical protein|nr:hypothetical protein [Cyanobacteriota bacterium]
MSRLVRMWLPQMGICLLLQGGLIGGGLVLHRWIAPHSPPCCDQPLAL